MLILQDGKGNFIQFIFFCAETSESDESHLPGHVCYIVRRELLPEPGMM